MDRACESWVNMLQLLNDDYSLRFRTGRGRARGGGSETQQKRSNKEPKAIEMLEEENES
jgi:hypothetical protein